MGTKACAATFAVAAIFATAPRASAYEFHVLHTFTGIGADRGDLEGGVVKIGPYLYGTSAAGSAAGSGQVYRLNPDGSGYTVLPACSPMASASTAPRATASVPTAPTSTAAASSSSSSPNPPPQLSS